MFLDTPGPKSIFLGPKNHLFGRVFRKNRRLRVLYRPVSSDLWYLKIFDITDWILKKFSRFLENPIDTLMHFDGILEIYVDSIGSEEKCARHNKNAWLRPKWCFGCLGPPLVGVWMSGHSGAKLPGMVRALRTRSKRGPKKCAHGHALCGLLRMLKFHQKSIENP